MAESKGYVDRPPRIQPTMPRGEVDIPPAPKRQKKSTMALRQSFLPLVTVVGYVLVSVFGQGRNLLMIVPMALSVVLTSVIAFQQFREDLREQEEQEKEYQLLLAEMRKELMNSHDMQRTFYLHNYPGPDRVLKIDGMSSDSRSGSRLWERRSSDNDFGAMRIGIGSRESTVKYKVQQGGGGSKDDEQPLSKDALRLVEESKVVFDVPILVPMFHHEGGSALDAINQPDEVEVAPMSARHAVGVVGEPRDVYALVRSMVTHFVGFHAPTDANVHVVGIAQAENEWNWLKNLPHCPVPKAKDVRPIFPLCFELPSGKDFDKEKDKVSLFWRVLRAELDQRNMRKGDKNVGDVRLPFLLVIVDMMEPLTRGPWLENSSLKDLESEAAVSMIINKGTELGAAVLFLVPDRRKVPSGCNAVIEVSQHAGEPDALDFRYAEVGVNSTRYVGRADTIRDIRVLNQFAENLSSWKVRRSYGEDIPGSLSLLDMFRTENIEGLNIATNWERSIKPESSEWMEGALGVMSGGAIRRLVYSADRDGVHGMVAGSTGSGKSELLMTLILGLAIRYDPSIINFVLIDYKGGAAFVPFANLPHCVDIVTNLQGAAVDRMFAAINAELNRRQEINTRENVKHIVHYRQKGLHLDENRPPYPHLFVIIDEFAEMMAGNAEYKAQLNSITRLGRALGVTLILAAQRPTGVTDQMRANIKFRISLRVETREESNEMLRRPDAAYLPPGVPGRGYLQVGNENIEMIQVAYSGAEYIGYDMGDASEGIDFRKYADRDVIWMDRVAEPNKEPPKLFEVLVAEMDRLSKQYSVEQKKPWPSPLPRYIGLGDPVPEIEYLHPEDLEYLRDSIDQLADEPLRLHAGVHNWLSDRRTQWNPVDWRERAMRAVVGLIDDPGNAQQRVLTLNFRRGHVALFGASGWGKTTLLRSTVLSLAAIHSPEELHVYILDFGGRALEVLRDLPHVGAIITPDEEERIDRFLRQMDAELEYRKQLLSQERANSVFSYNTRGDHKPLPSILVIVDNFSEFRENFESRIPFFSSLVREGLSNGLHFIVTGEQTGAIPSRLFSLFTERLTLKLADAAEYVSVVGRGVPGVDDLPGRGFLAMDRRPLEFQACIPVALTEEERSAGRDETRALATLIDKMNDAWDDAWSDPSLRPAEINTLRTFITLESILKPELLPEFPTAMIGINDRDLQPTLIDLRQQPHFVISGQQLSGKTATLRAWILSLAYRYTPEEVGFVLVDSLGFLSTYLGGKYSLAELPHVLDVATEKQDLDRVMEHLHYEYVTLPADQMRPREVFVFIDNYDEFKDMRPDVVALGNLTRSKPGRPALHFIACGTPLGMRSPDDFLKRVTMTRFALGMDSASVQAPPLNANIPRSLREGELPLGRGFLVRSGKTEMVQLATPYIQDVPPEQALDRWVEQILALHRGTRNMWIPIPESEKAAAATPAAATSNGGGKVATGSTPRAAATASAQTPTEVDGVPMEQVEAVRQQLIKMYTDIGLSDDLVKDLPPTGIVEMGRLRGLIPKKEENPVASGGND